EDSAAPGIWRMVRGEDDSVGAESGIEHAVVHSRTHGPHILIAAGGTGGHVFPALAIAQELQSRSGMHSPFAGEEGTPEIEFLGTGRGLESRVIPRAGFRLRTVAAAGLKGVGALKRLNNLLVLPRSALEAAAILREFRPDAVVGIGGYLAGPAMLEAALKDIPTLLIEPNAMPGFTNRVLAPMVRLAAVGFEEAARFYGAKARVTGHAVRREFFAVPEKGHVAPFTVLVLGGSQGSKSINKLMVEMLALLHSETVKFVHQTGERDYNDVLESYRERGVEAEIHKFIDDVPGALARADLVIARSGAATVAELAAAGRASLLIPFPHSTDQHQLHNARALERVGGARILEERELTASRLADQILELLGSPQQLATMRRAARRLARPNAAADIADLVEEILT
ncbi:MAG: undecaprenyldiphospho-muramoylpentapeptide beta-N-acetylglucosaminyltransferase, partial [Deltaproteobacteria bacterium]